MAITKPTVDTATWGNTNTSSPDQVVPGAGLINTGFLAYPVKLKRGHLNWLIGKLHQGLRYYMAQGIPAWDASEAQYVVGSVVTYSGLAYILNVASPAGTNPPTDTTHWGLLVPPSPGSLIRRSVITTTGTLAKAAGTNRARFRMVGAGGGSAGREAAAGPRLGGTGGAGSGAYGDFETTVIPATWSFTLNGAGLGGVDVGTGPGTNYAGTPGGSTVLFDGTNTFTCPGGSASVGFTGGDGGTIPTASPGGTIILAIPGDRGDDGGEIDIAYNSQVHSGRGGSTPFGHGGASQSFGGGGLSAALNGKDGIGYGSGAGGCTTYTSQPKDGGAGKKGVIIFEEYS